MSVRPRGIVNGLSSYQINAYLGRDANGKQVRRYEQFHGNKKDALARERQMRAEFDKTGRVFGSKFTVKTWLEHWMNEYAKKRTRQRTWEKYETVIRLHIVDYIGKLDLVKLSPTDVRTFEAKLQEDGRSVHQIERSHILLSSALKYAVEGEILGRNVCKLVKVAHPAKKEVEIPNIAVVQQILRYAEDAEHFLFPCLHLIAYTGLRRGEAIALTWKDVDLSKSTLRVTRTLSRANTGLIFEEPKTPSSARRFYLDGRTVEILKNHKSKQQSFKERVGTEYFHDQGLIFTDEHGDPLNPMRVTRTIQAIGHKLSIPERLIVHALRHWYATMMLANGVDLMTVAKRMGHKDPSTTLKMYGHVLPGKDKEAADKVASVMATTLATT